MKDPVDHILRPRLPWRSDEGAITECGYDASKVKTLSRDEYFRRVKDLGSQRSAILTCMTCSDTASRWDAWEGGDPRKALEREIIWESGGYYRRPAERGHRLLDELLAIAALIERHRDEFVSVVAEHKGRREWNEQKLDLRQRKSARPPKDPSGGWWPRPL